MWVGSHLSLLYMLSMRSEKSLDGGHFVAKELSPPLPHVTNQFLKDFFFFFFFAAPKHGRTEGNG